jgi:hypothetical protein
MSVRDTLTKEEQEIFDELKAKCWPKPKPKPKVKAAVVEHPASKQLTAEERFRLICEHNQALMRELQREAQELGKADPRQSVIDAVWEQNLEAWHEREQAYVWTCHRGPGDSDWGRR